MRSAAYEGGGYVVLEFEAGFNSDAALADVRAKVDQAKHDLPKDATCFNCDSTGRGKSRSASPG